MGYPRVCPECGADLTEMGAVTQTATELGHWSVRIDENDEAEFGEFTTTDTIGDDGLDCAECEAHLDWTDHEEEVSDVGAE